MTRKYLDDPRSLSELIRLYGEAVSTARSRAAIASWVPEAYREALTERKELEAEISARVEYLESILAESKKPQSTALLDQRIQIVNYIRNQAVRMERDDTSEFGVGKGVALVLKAMADNINTFRDQDVT